MLERIIQTLLEMSWETKRPFLVSRKILGFLSIFKKSQALSPLRVELHEPLEVSKDVRPPVQMRRGTRVLSRVSTVGSDIPYLERLKTSLHSSHFREIRPYF